MLSTMQDVPLQVRRLFEHGTSVHGNAQLATAVPGGYRHGTYAQVGRNAARLAQALRALGIGPGDRVGTFMWNNQEHVEAYYAAPCMGAVIHPLNIRLAHDQIVFIANHAEGEEFRIEYVIKDRKSGMPRFGLVMRRLIDGRAIDCTSRGLETGSTAMALEACHAMRATPAR